MLRVDRAARRKQDGAGEIIGMAVDHLGHQICGGRRRHDQIAVARQAAMVGANIVVAVPGLSGSVPHLDETNTALEQAAGDHHLPRLNAFAIPSLARRGSVGPPVP